VATDARGISAVDVAVYGTDGRVVRREVAAEPERFWVAVRGDDVVGFGAVRRTDWGRHGLPEGWYLTRVAVSATHRRAGIGAALVETRLDALDLRTAECWYLTQQDNDASLRLHAGFGFVVAAAGAALPGRVRGRGWLLRRRRPVARFEPGDYGDVFGVVLSGEAGTQSLSDRFVDPLWHALVDQGCRHPVVTAWVRCDGWTDDPATVEAPGVLARALRGLVDEAIAPHAHGARVVDCRIVAVVVAEALEAGPVMLSRW
jgi:ribosomal protein S18 acetylase RimI-like enzyme